MHTHTHSHMHTHIPHAHAPMHRSHLINGRGPGGSLLHAQHHQRHQHLIRHLPKGACRGTGVWRRAQVRVQARVHARERVVPARHQSLSGATTPTCIHGAANAGGGCAMQRAGTQGCAQEHVPAAHTDPPTLAGCRLPAQDSTGVGWGRAGFEGRPRQRGRAGRRAARGSTGTPGAHLPSRSSACSCRPSWAFRGGGAGSAGPGAGPSPPSPPPSASPPAPAPPWAGDAAAGTAGGAPAGAPAGGPGSTPEVALARALCPLPCCELGLPEAGDRRLTRASCACRLPHSCAAWMASAARASGSSRRSLKRRARSLATPVLPAPRHQCAGSVSAQPRERVRVCVRPALRWRPASELRVPGLSA